MPFLTNLAYQTPFRRIGDIVRDYLGSTTTISREVPSEPKSMPPRPQFKPTPMPSIDKVAQRRAERAMTPTPTVTPTPTPTVTPTPTPTVSPKGQTIPSGTKLAMDYLRANMPPSSKKTVRQYYPALSNREFERRVREADEIREGLSNLLLLQAFFESTLGRGGSNIFGIKPRGRPTRFTDPVAALEEQLSPRVLGGGASGKLNLLRGRGPITRRELERIYASYNPNSSYFEEYLIPILFDGGGR